MTTVITLNYWTQENNYLSSRTLSLKTVHTKLGSAIILKIEYEDILPTLSRSIYQY